MLIVGTVNNPLRRIEKEYALTDPYQIKVNLPCQSAV
jgi:hypothetical protein